MSGGRRSGRSGALGAFCACLLLLIFASSASATTFTVTNGNDSGDGSLRKAIADAEDNANEPTVDLIRFTYTGNIDLDGTLPDILFPVTIDGPGPSNLHIRRPSTASSSFGIFAVDPGAAYTVTIKNLTVTGGSAGVGAGITMDGAGTLIVDSVVLTDNHATANGGGLYYADGFTSIRNSTLSDNDADFGGALLGDVGGDAELVNSTVTGNRATSFGGGVYSNGGIEILSSTIQGNTANSDDDSLGDGGGIYTGGDGTDFSIANTLLAGNLLGSSTPTPQQCASPITSFGYNLSETDDSAAGCNGFDATGDITGNPMLGSLSTAGPTPAFPLLAGSPAINAGNPTAPGSSGFPICPSADQLGSPRGGSNGICDIGAFEVQVPAGPPAPGPVASAFNLKAAVKKCKKKFPKGPKRKKCIKRAKRRAGL